MSAKITLPPEMYHGDVLCERCGDNGRGERFAICAEGYDHALTCERYVYDGLCATCEDELSSHSSKGQTP